MSTLTRPPNRALAACRVAQLLPGRCALFLLLPLLLAACRPPVVRPAKPCRPRCRADNSCSRLDQQLLAARRPMLHCVGRQAQAGDLQHAHRCYRALRMLESARWWLRTLTGEDPLHTVYAPSESTTREFQCRIEALARATSPAEVERLYLELVRSFP